MLFQPGYPCVVVCASALFIGSEPRSDKEGLPAKTKAPAQMNATWKHALGGEGEEARRTLFNIPSLDSPFTLIMHISHISAGRHHS